jgi:hypothetical protein
MQGGMTMVGGNMFDNALKARVDALCGDLAQLLATTTVFPRSMTTSLGGFTSAGWWPPELGVPSATGAQNDARYAVFPATRRLAIQINGVTRVFDTGEHHIGGVQQQQGGGYGSAGFTSQFGTFFVSTLPELDIHQVAETPTAAQQYQTGPAQGSASPAQPPQPAPASPSTSTSKSTSTSTDNPAAIIAAIKSLGELHEQGILTDDEFATKKTELLGRL